MADEQHVAEPGGQVEGVERLAGQRAVDRDLDPERRAGQLGGLQRAQLGARQAGVDVGAEPLERAAGGLGLMDPALGQRTLVVGEAVRRLGVAKQPEHA